MADGRTSSTSPSGLSLRQSACRSLFVCDGRPSVTDGIWTDGRTDGGTARNRVRRFIHQSTRRLRRGRCRVHSRCCWVWKDRRRAWGHGDSRRLDSAELVILMKIINYDASDWPRRSSESKRWLRNSELGEDYIAVYEYRTCHITHDSTDFILDIVLSLVYAQFSSFGCVV